MPRTTLTLARIIGADFDLLLKLVNNLLVNNKNFESGYYVRTHPATGEFIRRVLPSFAEGISQRVETLKDVVVQNLEGDSEREAALCAAISKLLSVMEMQQHRSDESFHLSAEAFMPLWNGAMEEARALLPTAPCGNCATCGCSKTTKEAA